jgi:hypothetical protein
LILLLDVLEHIDKGFVTNLIQSYASPGTLFLITVPLYPFLYSEHDINLGHKRRHAYAELQRLMRNEGLHIVRSGYLFSSLLIIRLLQLLAGKVYSRLKPGRKGSSFADVTAWNHSPFMTKIVKGFLYLDVKYANRFPGLSGYVLASLP